MQVNRYVYLQIKWEGEIPYSIFVVNQLDKVNHGTSGLLINWSGNYFLNQLRMLLFFESGGALSTDLWYYFSWVGTEFISEFLWSLRSHPPPPLWIQWASPYLFVKLIFAIIWKSMDRFNQLPNCPRLRIVLAPILQSFNPRRSFELSSVSRSP